MSVLMPVRNAEQFVQQAIGSILNQSLQDFEFIIIDDGSTDNTLSILKSYNDPRILLFESENKGVSYQSNFAVSNAHAKYISKMDADDISHVNRLEEHYSFMEKNPDVKLIGNNIQFIDSANRRLNVMKYPEFNADINYFLPVRPTVLNGTITMHKSAFEKLDGYNTKLEVGEEDHEFLIRFCEAGYLSYNIQDVMYYYRVYERPVNRLREEKQNRMSYMLGKDILQKQKDSGSISEYDFNYKIGLIEYYRGSLKVANHFFVLALKSRWTKLFHLFRFIIVSSVLSKSVTVLRKKGTMRDLNIFLNKYLGVDLYKLKK